MARCQLRVYYGPEENRSVDTAPEACREHQVTVPLRDILLTLADAVNGRSWLAARF